VIGLVGALQTLCAELTHAGLGIAFTHDNVPATLPLSGTSDGVTLTIRDNGIGFDVDAAWGTGIGLRSMLERLQAVGGTLKVTSGFGAGTGLLAFVPWHAMQSDPRSQPAATAPGETPGTDR
jgi:signal transduction histidine kinase